MGVPTPSQAALTDPQQRAAWFNGQVLPELQRGDETHYGYKIVDASLALQPDIGPLALSDPDLKVIVMSRNPMAGWLSNSVCMADNIWRREVAEGPLESRSPVTSQEWMQQWVHRTTMFWQMVTQMPWERSVVTYTELCLNYQEVMSQICDWLELEWNGAEKPLSRTRPEMVRDRKLNVDEIWRCTPGFWARDMYEVLAEEPHSAGPHV